MKDNELLDKIDVVFGEYGGKKRFIVTHPKYNKAVRVAAPSDTAAIVAAAIALLLILTEYADSRKEKVMEMAEYIGCRDCTSPDCKGCNLKNLETMLKSGKFDCLMNGNRCIVMGTEVIPVKHGRWKQIMEPFGWDEIDCIVCSECKESWIIAEDFGIAEASEYWHYCPNCGAKMDKGEEDG